MYIWRLIESYELPGFELTHRVWSSVNCYALPWNHLGGVAPIVGRIEGAASGYCMEGHGRSRKRLTPRLSGCRRASGTPCSLRCRRCAKSSSSSLQTNT